MVVNNCSILLRLLLSMLLAVTFSSSHAQSDLYKQAFTAYQTQDFDKAAEIWKGLAENGDINAQYAYAVMHLREEIPDAGKTEAFYWFEKAATQGHTTAMFNVGVAYWEGSGVKKDRKQALRWWEQSAQAGDVGAQFNLGLAYYLGEERNSDVEKAKKWLGMAAEQNHPEAKKIYDALVLESGALPADQLAESAPENEASDESITDESISDESIVVLSNEIESSGSGSADTESSIAETPSEQDSESDQPESPDAVEIKVAEAPTLNFWRTVVDVSLLTVPGENGREFLKLPKEMPIEVIETKGNWSKITLPEGIKTWIYENYIEVNGSKGTVKGSGVRIRPEPSTENSASPPLGSYDNGASVTVLDKKDNWVRIRSPKNIGGWVKSSQIGEYSDTAENRKKMWENMLSKGY